MAGRILNRRELRDQAAHALPPDGGASDATLAVAPPEKRVRAKARAAPRLKKPRAKKAPPRIFARWGLFDSAMKQVAIFNYNQRAAADEKLAHLRASKKGLHFLQIVKDVLAEPEPVPAEGSSMPDETASPAAARPANG